MFTFYVGARSIFVKTSDILVENSVNAYLVNLQFAPEWADLAKHAVFKAGSQKIDIIIGENNQCQIPWEVLQKPKIDLFFGVYGVSQSDEGETVILRTSYANIGTIQEGANEGDEQKEATLTVYQQLLTKVSELTTKVSELEAKIIEVSGNVGNLSDLTTNVKTDIVSAINSIPNTSGNVE